MLRKAALAFSIVLVLVGVLGFVPALTPSNSAGMPLLLGLFMVGTLHNIIHLASGIAAYFGSTSEKYAQLYFRVFGVVYGLVTVLGFIEKDTVLGILPVNMADNLLHTLIAASALYLGFGVKRVLTRA
jgi:hypothetical protein